MSTRGRSSRRDRAARIPSACRCRVPMRCEIRSVSVDGRRAPSLRAPPLLPDITCRGSASAGLGISTRRHDRNCRKASASMLRRLDRRQVGLRNRAAGHEHGVCEHPFGAVGTSPPAGLVRRAPIFVGRFLEPAAHQIERLLLRFGGWRAPRPALQQMSRPRQTASSRGRAKPR